MPNHKTTLTVLSFILIIMLVVIMIESVKVWIREIKKNKTNMEIQKAV
jgi:carbon starvation protein